MCNRDELHEINVKLDHLSYLQCEMFTILKSYTNIDHKVDQTIRLLHKMNSTKQYPVSSTYTKPPIFVKPSTNKHKGISIQDSLMNELKMKLKKRGGIKD